MLSWRTVTGRGLQLSEHTDTRVLWTLLSLSFNIKTRLVEPGCEGVERVRTPQECSGCIRAGEPSDQPKSVMSTLSVSRLMAPVVPRPICRLHLELRQQRPPVYAVTSVNTIGISTVNGLFSDRHSSPIFFISFICFLSQHSVTRKQ